MSNWPKIPGTVMAQVSHFQMVLPYLGSEWETIRKLGISRKVETGPYETNYLWTFPMENWDALQRALARVVQLDKEPLVRDIIPKCEPLLKELEATFEKKGRSGITATVEEEVYVLTWFEQGEEKKWRVCKTLVEFIWENVISKMQAGREGMKKSPWVAERIVRALEKHHWDTTDLQLYEEANRHEEERKYICQGQWNYDKSGDFNWHYFNGDRSHYFNLFYYPMKAMVALGLIEHTRGGYVIRICPTDEFESQTHFVEIKLMEQEIEKANAPPAPGTAQDWHTWDFPKGEDGQGRLF